MYANFNILPNLYDYLEFDIDGDGTITTEVCNFFVQNTPLITGFTHIGAFLVLYNNTLYFAILLFSFLFSTILIWNLA